MFKTIGLTLENVSNSPTQVELIGDNLIINNNTLINNIGSFIERCNLDSKMHEHLETSFAVHNYMTDTDVANVVIVPRYCRNVTHCMPISASQQSCVTSMSPSKCYTLHAHKSSSPISKNFLMSKHQSHSESTKQELEGRGSHRVTMSYSTQLYE